MKLKPLASALVVLVAGFGIYWFMNGMRKVPDQPVAANAATMAALIKHPAPKDIAAFSFADHSGATLDLSHWNCAIRRRYCSDVTEMFRYINARSLGGKLLGIPQSDAYRATRRQFEGL